MAQPQTHPSSPRCPEGVTPAERLMFWSLRAWASARHAGEPPQAPLGELLAAKTSARVAALFMAWVQAVEAASLRPIRGECPHCGGASGDLQRLVVACGIAPVAFELGERLLEPLVSDTRTVMVLARSLNAALAAAGWPLPARVGVLAALPAASETVH
ncbi:MAG: hypothetical protein ABW360_15985 [Phenylobacterium sp.]